MGMTFARETVARPHDSLPVYDARDLTKEGDLAHIMLDGQIYTLRITRAGKLILTK
jgi:hemin uptake protein HemP